MLVSLSWIEVEALARVIESELKINFSLNWGGEFSYVLQGYWNAKCIPNMIQECVNFNILYRSKLIMIPCL